MSIPSPSNLFDPAFREPYLFYAESRARGPVAQVDQIGAWLVATKGRLPPPQTD